MKRKQRIRLHFREAVLSRDGHRCRLCGWADDVNALDAHHITDRNAMPQGGYVAANGITLCPTCHRAAERFHESDGARWIEGMHPDDLYARIGSSAEAARAASEAMCWG